MWPSPPQEEQVYRLDPQMTDPQAWNRCWMGRQPAALSLSSSVPLCDTRRGRKVPNASWCRSLFKVTHGLFEMFQFKHCLCSATANHSLRDLGRQTLFKSFVLESVYWMCLKHFSLCNTSLDMIKLDVWRISIALLNVQGASIPCKVSRPPGQATYADVARAPAVGSLGRGSQGTCSLRDMQSSSMPIFQRWSDCHNQVITRHVAVVHTMHRVCLFMRLMFLFVESFSVVSLSCFSFFCYNLQLGHCLRSSSLLTLLPK